jgi:hypothetical protein
MVKKVNESTGAVIINGGAYIKDSIIDVVGEG